MKKYEFQGKCWHEQCFRCADCNVEIGGNQFIPLPPEGGVLKIVCLKCYDLKHALRCAKCQQVIGPIHSSNTFYAAVNR